MSLTLKPTPSLINFFCPDNLDLNALFEAYPRFSDEDRKELFSKKNKELKTNYLKAFYYIITQIVRKKWNNQLKKHTSYEISAKSFGGGIHWRIQKKAIEYLIELNVIKRSGCYIKGVRPFAYSICSPFNEGKVVSIQTLQSRTNGPAGAVFAHANKGGLSASDFDDLDESVPKVVLSGPVEQFLFDNLSQVTISEDVFGYLDSLDLASSERQIYRHKVGKIQKQKFYFSRSLSTGRVFTNITELPAKAKTTMGQIVNIRQFLRFDGEKLFEIDLHATYPFLAIKFYDDCPFAAPEDIDAERKRYKQLFQGGAKDFYTNFGRLVREGIRRETVKNCFIINCLTGDKPRFPDGWLFHDAFKNHFPILFRVVAEIKNPNHKEISRVLQKIESDLMIDGICAEIARTSKIFVLTIHDAILTTASNVSYVRQLMESTFQNAIAVKPIIKDNRPDRYDISQPIGEDDSGL